LTMSSYNGRRAPNFSQYLEDLNAIPPPYERPVRQQDDPFNLDAELAMFTNTEFLDFDNFPDVDMPVSFDAIPEEKTQSHETGLSNKALGSEYLDLLNGDLSLADLASTDFNTNNVQPSQASTFPSAHPVSQPFNDTPSFETETNVAQVPLQQANTTTSSSSTPSSAQNQGAADKRKAAPDVKSPDEAARFAAEEDKRRRNTAASARFRIKKKQREQTLERTVKDATEKNSALEARVSQLELENQWLKNLITEKKSQGDSKEEKTENDIAQMFKKFLATHKSVQRSLSTSKSGVGTRA